MLLRFPKPDVTSRMPGMFRVKDMMPLPVSTEELRRSVPVKEPTLESVVLPATSIRPSP